MSLHLVRCPYCSRRFNISGIAAGARLRCSGCTAVLTVPRPDARTRRPFWPPNRSLVLQTAGGAVAVLVTVAALYVVLRSSRPHEPTVAVVPRPPVEEPPKPVLDEKVPPDGYLHDPLSKAKQAILEEFGASFHFYDRVSPYLIAFEPSDRFALRPAMEDHGKRLSAVYAAFRKQFGAALNLPEVAVEDVVLTVVVLNSRESYDRYNERQMGRHIGVQCKGLYEPENRRIVVYCDSDAPGDVLFHEGAHQLVHYYALRASEKPRTDKTWWFWEGLGVYFETFRKQADGRFEFEGGVNRSRLLCIKQALHEDRKDFIPLAALVGMTVNDFWKWYENDPARARRRADLCYSESWALVYFLRHKGGNYQKTFEDYFRAELEGRGSKAVFEQLVQRNLGLELADLEQEFVAYVLSLR